MINMTKVLQEKLNRIFNEGVLTHYDMYNEQNLNFNLCLKPTKTEPILDATEMELTAVYGDNGKKVSIPNKYFEVYSGTNDYDSLYKRLINNILKVSLKLLENSISQNLTIILNQKVYDILYLNLGVNENTLKFNSKSLLNSNYLIDGGILLNNFQIFIDPTMSDIDTKVCILNENTNESLTFLIEI